MNNRLNHTLNTDKLHKSFFVSFLFASTTIRLQKSFDKLLDWGGGFNQVTPNRRIKRSKRPSWLSVGGEGRALLNTAYIKG